MIQRKDKQAKNTGKNRSRRADSRIRNRRPQLEKSRYHGAPTRLALFTAPPRDKAVYSIGELVGVAYERAALLADDAATESLVATRLLAEWLTHARSTSSAAARRPAETTRVRRPLPQSQRTRTRRLPARRSSFSSSVPGWRAAA